MDINNNYNLKPTRNRWDRFLGTRIRRVCTLFYNYMVYSTDTKMSAKCLLRSKKSHVSLIV
jgi:hypothetical protein